MDAIASLRSLTNTSYYEDTDEDTKFRFAKAQGCMVQVITPLRRYYLLPSLNGSEWNKYLLAGLIRCYMDNDYSIAMISMDYRVSDFLIKKKAKLGKVLFGLLLSLTM